jgi:hypothetical protein
MRSSALILSREVSVSSSESEPITLRSVVTDSCSIASTRFATSYVDRIASVIW